MHVIAWKGHSRIQVKVDEIDYLVATMKEAAMYANSGESSEDQLQDYQRFDMKVEL